MRDISIQGITADGTAAVNAFEILSHFPTPMMNQESRTRQGSRLDFIMNEIYDGAVWAGLMHRETFS
jgi:hypothetical protein